MSDKTQRRHERRHAELVAKRDLPDKFLRLLGAAQDLVAGRDHRRDEALQTIAEADTFVRSEGFTRLERKARKATRAAEKRKTPADPDRCRSWTGAAEGAGHRCRLPRGHEGHHRAGDLEAWSPGMGYDPDNTTARDELVERTVAAMRQERSSP